MLCVPTPANPDFPPILHPHPVTPPPPFHPHLPQLPEVGAGYTFFRDGRPKAERRNTGIVFAIRNEIVGQPPCLPQGTKDPLVSLCLTLQRKIRYHNQRLRSPMTNPSAARNKFYDDLHALLATVPR
nr:unnamed protein product [Spirometra erinaceieuropaei]